MSRNIATRDWYGFEEIDDHETITKATPVIIRPGHYPSAQRIAAQKYMQHANHPQKSRNPMKILKASDVTLPDATLISSAPSPSVVSVKHSTPMKQHKETDSDATVIYNLEDYAPPPAAKGAFQNRICGITRGGKKRDYITARSVT